VSSNSVFTTSYFYNKVPMIYSCQKHVMNSFNRKDLGSWIRLKRGVGYHKKGYPDKSNKNRKRQSKTSAITTTRAPAHLSPRSRTQIVARPTPLASDASSVSPDPLGLGRRRRLARPPRPRRKFRLARPIQGSGAKRRFTGSGQGFQRIAPVPTTWQVR